MGYSQKGDVYSFSIILQEVILRSEPFEENHMEVDGNVPSDYDKRYREQNNLT